MAAKTINYFGNQKIDNSEMVTKKVKDSADSVKSTIGNLASLHTANKTSAVAAINELKDSMPATIAVDTALDPSSTNPVQNKVVKNEFSNVKNLIGPLSGLNTTAKTSVVDAVNELKGTIPAQVIVDDHVSDTGTNPVQSKAVAVYAAKKSDLTATNNRVTEIEKKLPFDAVPTEDSSKGAESGGIFNAVRFASARVGDTMYWPISRKEHREVYSDNPFNFTFNGKEYSVTTQDDYIDMLIAKDVPDGWHALDGEAALEAAEYPDLAAFMPSNVTTDGKVWLPYVSQKIIKVKY